MDEALLAQLVALRRDIHAHPELAFEEVNTRKKIREALLGAGIAAESMREMARTGLVVDVDSRAEAGAAGAGAGAGASDGGAKGLRIALRADMDCLPVDDKVTAPHASTVPKRAHACGHDGHVATMVGMAIQLHRVADRLPAGCSVRFLFQPAEEGPGGALPMCEEGAMEGVDFVYGYHNCNMLPLSSVWVQPGVASGHCVDFDITITGTGGHASLPHTSSDALHCAAMCVVAINGIRSRRVSPFSPCVISVCSLQAGDTHNVIPSVAVLKGTMRDFDPAVAERLKTNLKAVVEGTVAANPGCSVTIDLDDSYPCTINNKDEAAVVHAVCEDVLGTANVLGDVGGGMLGAEDFSYFAQRAPGVFLQFGGWTPATKCPVPHEPEYDFNDDIIPRAMAVFVRLLETKFGVALLDTSTWVARDEPINADVVARFKSVWQ